MMYKNTIILEQNKIFPYRVSFQSFSSPSCRIPVDLGHVSKRGSQACFDYFWLLYQIQNIARELPKPTSQVSELSTEILNYSTKVPN